MTKIISGFPGIGKTHFYKTVPGVLDSDSSYFSWSTNSEGVKSRNPHFPKNYLEYIKFHLGKMEYILVSSHKVVRDMLREENVKYTLVYPHIDAKSRYIQRYINRGSPKEFVDMMENNFEKFVAECENETFPDKVVLIGNDYLSDWSL